jgi:hypothetical protein
MGYGNYAPGANSRMADSLTPLQQKLRALPLDSAQDTLALVDKLTRNVVRNPGEEKFRKINLSNEKIKKAIADVPNGIELLQEMGWVLEGEALLLPSSVRLAHEVHVVGIIEAQDHYKSEAEKERVRQTRARKEVDEDKEKLRQQMEADRREKTAEGPVTKGSVAQKMPGDGANIVRASDLGIGQNAGG